MDRQLLLAKKEVTYGVDAGAVAANGVVANNPSFKMTGSRVTPDPARPGVGPGRDRVYGEHVELGFDVELASSGDPGVAPMWGFIMKACGWSETIVLDAGDESVTYRLMANPKACDSLTLVWRDGNQRKHLVRGWRGRVGLQLSAGQIPMLKFMGRGLHTDVTEAPALTHADAVFAGWQDATPVANGTTDFTFAGVADLGVREFTFDQTDNVKFVDLPGQENVELLGARVFNGNMKITCPKPSTLNLESKWRTGSVEPWSLIHESEAGKIVTVSGRSQLIDPNYAREDDHDVASASLKCVPSSLVADDDLVIVLT